MNETRRLLVEALKALRAYKSPQDLIEEIAAHLSDTDSDEVPSECPGHENRHHECAHCGAVF
jgi:hypothetical protein